MKRFKMIIMGTAMFAWLIVIFISIIQEINHEKTVKEMQGQITKLEKDYKELDGKMINSEYDYEQKIKKLKEKIDELNAEIVDLQNKNSELRDDNMNLRLQVDELKEAKAKKQEEKAAKAVTYTTPSGACLTPTSGIYWFGEQLETYYNLDMSTVVAVAQSSGIAGDYWVRSDGCKMLGDYIMVAACYDVHPYGSTVQTSLGTGIVVDTGGFAANNPTQIDIAVNW